VVKLHYSIHPCKVNPLVLFLEGSLVTDRILDFCVRLLWLAAIFISVASSEKEVVSVTYLDETYSTQQLMNIYFTFQTKLRTLYLHNHKKTDMGFFPTKTSC